MKRFLKKKELFVESLDGDGKKKEEAKLLAEKSERAMLNARLSAISLELDNMSRGGREPFKN